MMREEAVPPLLFIRQYRAIRRRHLWRILRTRQPCQINELARLVASDPGTLRVPVRACLQKSRFTPSKPSIFAIASCTKFIHICTTSFVRYCLYRRKKESPPRVLRSGRHFKRKSLPTSQRPRKETRAVQGHSHDDDVQHGTNLLFAGFARSIQPL